MNNSTIEIFGTLMTAEEIENGFSKLKSDYIELKEKYDYNRETLFMVKNCIKSSATDDKTILKSSRKGVVSHV